MNCFSGCDEKEQILMVEVSYTEELIVVSAVQEHIFLEGSPVITVLLIEMLVKHFCLRFGYESKPLVLLGN